MRIQSAIRLLKAAADESGISAPLLLARFGALTIVNRTSRRRAITRVPQPVAPRDKDFGNAPAPRGDVVIPVYNNYEDTVALLAALARDASFQGRIILVHDCSIDARMAPLLRDFVTRHPRSQLIENETNLGFVKSCNRGFKASTTDVVILNTDITLPAGALNRLLRRLQSAPDIATVTPFSNSAYGVGLPDLLYPNALPFGAKAEDIDAALRNLVPVANVELGTGIGFCLAISRAAIDRLTGFDEAYGMGYGEETDFCQRASKLGLKHVLGVDVFVEHMGGKSFANTWKDKSRKGLLKVLNRHPRYVDRVRGYLMLGEARAVACAGLSALAARLAGMPLDIREGVDARRGASSADQPILRIERTGTYWRALISYRREHHAFRFASRALLAQALEMAGIELRRS